MLRVPTYQRNDVHEDWTVVLRDDRGQELVIEGHPIDSVPMSIQAPNDLVHGLSGIADERHCLLSPSWPTCNGEDGSGHLELSRYNGG